MTDNTERTDFDENDPQQMIVNLHEGMTVISEDSEEVGTIEKVYRPVGVDQMDSQTSDIFSKVSRSGLGSLLGDIYIPAEFVKAIDGDTVRLSLSKDRIGDMPWSQPPVPLPEEGPGA